MDYTITKLNKYDSTVLYMLIYGNDHYSIHTVDATINNTVKVTKLNIDNIEPKYITPFLNYQKFGYWQIIDIFDRIHLLVIHQDGTLVLRKSVCSTPMDCAMLAIYRLDDLNKFVMYYTDKSNTVKQKEYNCYPLAQIHIDTTLLYASTVVDILSPASNIKYIAHRLYITSKNKLFCLDNNNKLTQVDDYPNQIIGSTINYNKDTFDITSSVIYKNGKIIHQFTHVHYALGICHVSEVNRLVIMFGSKDGITYLIDNGESTIVQKFHVDNMKFVGQVSILSLLNFKDGQQLHKPITL